MNKRTPSYNNDATEIVAGIGKRNIIQIFGACTTSAQARGRRRRHAALFASFVLSYTLPSTVTFLSRGVVQHDADQPFFKLFSKYWFADK